MVKLLLGDLFEVVMNLARKWYRKLHSIGSRQLPGEFLLFSSFTKSMGFYYLLVTVIFALLLAVLFQHFLTTLLEVSTAMADIEEELLTFMKAYVTDTLIWIFVLICAFMLVCVALATYGAKRYEERQTSS